MKHRDLDHVDQNKRVLILCIYSPDQRDLSPMNETIDSAVVYKHFSQIQTVPRILTCVLSKLLILPILFLFHS